MPRSISLASLSIPPRISGSISITVTGPPRLLQTLSFYPPEYHKALGYLGSHSGRDEDKVAAVGLTPAFGDGFTYFEEAELVLVCRKLYAAPLVKEGFLDQDVLDRYYPEVDLHTMYIGAIEKVLVKE